MDVDAGTAGLPPDDVDQEAGYQPEYDERLDEALAIPTSVEALYLGEASVYRPLGTGDVFVSSSGEAGDGSPETLVMGEAGDGSPETLVMLVAHPCAIRKGSVLEPRARSAPVVAAQGISKSKWTNGHFDFFPLPGLRGVAAENGFDVDDRAWGVLLKHAAPVDTETMTVSNRVACLGPEGLRLLLQRLVHCDTRVAVKPLAIEATYKPEAEEMELFETWNTDLVPQRLASGQPLDEALLAEAGEFDSFAGSGDPSPRELLRQPDTVSRGRRLITQEIRRRMRDDSSLC